jgi:hypothetical protein
MRSADARVASVAHHRLQLDQLSKDLDFKSMDDWYSFGALQSRRLALPLEEFDGSIVYALKACYPDHNWKVWKFAKVPQGWWTDVKNQRAFFEEIAPELGVSQLSDWYRIPRSRVSQAGGTSLLTGFYKNNLPVALMAAFPEHQFHLWRFKSCRVPLRYWSDKANQKAFLEWCYSHLNLKSVEGWYNVRVATIASLRGGAMLRTQYGFSLYRALVALYPEHQWDPKRFATSPYTATIAETSNIATNAAES